MMKDRDLGRYNVTISKDAEVGQVIIPDASRIIQFSSMFYYFNINRIYTFFIKISFINYLTNTMGFFFLAISQ